MSPINSILSFILLLIPLQHYAQNVGIGTASPNHKLVVEGDRIKLQNKEATKFFHIRTDGDEIDITTMGSHFWITAGENKDIILNPSKSSAGFVGIGTHAPSEKLHIQGGIRVESLTGEGNRILYSTPTGIVQAGLLDISKLEARLLELEDKIRQQDLLIQQLLQEKEAKNQ